MKALAVMKPKSPLFSVAGSSRKEGSAELPLLRPDPPRLSQHTRELALIEESGIYSNYGPTNARLERAFIDTVFLQGDCVTVCNATIGLMMAIRDVIGDNRPQARRYALMPAFTFAATAHAALWCGLTPLFCDIDSETWLPSKSSEEDLLKRYPGEIAVVVPYATFGNNLDLARYEELSKRFDVPIVVDAAASLGSLDEAGKAFGSGFRWPVVFSMHATKAFSVGEGGLIYSGDLNRIRRLRTMGAFGFEQPRSATMLGLNSKLSEVAALTALLQLERFPATVRERVTVARWYRSELHRDFVLQSQSGYQRANAFISVLLPTSVAPFRSQIAAALAAQHIGTGTYFSPHVAEQPYFQQHGVASDLSVTQDVASRVLALPLLQTMSFNDVARVASALRVASGVYDRSLNRHMRAARKPETSPEVLERSGMLRGSRSTTVAGPR